MIVGTIILLAVLLLIGAKVLDIEVCKKILSIVTAGRVK